MVTVCTNPNVVHVKEDGWTEECTVWDTRIESHHLDTPECGKTIEGMALEP